MAAQAMAAPVGGMLPPEFQFGTAAPLHAADAARAQQQLLDQQAAAHSSSGDACSRYAPVSLL